jgi:BirA family transcriptional regulator, biotin operon repressor / biotin---[acetyl-CoA-carboxylase] ligase
MNATAHLTWSAEALWRMLEPHLPGVSVEVVARAESTNTLLLERARSGAGRRDAPVTTPGELEALRQRGVSTEPAALDSAGVPRGRRSDDTQPCLLVAEHQTLGRGRQGRAWVSAPGASLTFSLSLPLAPADWSGLSLAVGVALADAIEPPDPALGAPRLLLKWPNDLWLRDDAAPGGGRKLGGVLIETVAVGARRMVVVGVGLNIAPLASPPAGVTLANGYASLQELDPQASAPQALHRVALPVVRALRQFEREGFAGAYARRDLLRGKRIATTDTRTEAALDGMAEGVAPSGALRLRSDDGTLHEISSGEVGVRLGDRAG